MVHKRSVEAMQRKTAKDTAKLYCHHDRILKELDATTETEQKIKESLKQTSYNQTGHKFIHTYILEAYKAGDVLEDTKGRGTLQRMILTARGYIMSDLTPVIEW